MAGTTERTVEVASEVFVLRFAPVADVLAAVKSIPNRTFTYTPQPHWIVPVQSQNASRLIEVIEAFQFTVSPETRSVLDTLIAKAQTAPSVRRVEIQGGRAKLFFERQLSDVREAIKALPASKYEPLPQPHWSIMLQDLPQLQHLFDVYAFSVPRSIKEKVRKDARDMARRREWSEAQDHPATDMHPALRPFQRAGVAYMREVGLQGCLNADDMGLGKTLQALATIDVLGAYPALIVTIASAKYSWQREVERWFPQRSVAVLSGTKHDPSDIDADVVIVNYDILAKRLENGMDGDMQRRRFKSITLDEVHALKDPKTQRSKAVKLISGRSKLRLGLTGTPLLNRPVELAAILDSIGRLEDFGGFFAFAKRYCDGRQVMRRNTLVWDFTGASNLDELHDKLRSICMIRRLKTDVLSELPAKTRSVVPIAVDNMAEYERAVLDFRKWVEENARQDRAFFATIAHLPPAERQLKHEKYVTEVLNKLRFGEQLIKIGQLRQLAAKGKLKGVVEWITNKQESGEKLLVFAIHIEIQHALLQAFPNAAHILAEDAVLERQVQIDRFQQDARCTLMINSLGAGGVAITLTAASHVAMVECGWTPGIMDQAEDRVHRMGQRNAVNIWYLTGLDTIDEDMIELLDAKRSVISSAIDGGQSNTGSILEELMQRITAGVSGGNPRKRRK